MRRLQDQALILRAIGDVRQELRVAEAQDEHNAQLFAVLGRLVSLYAILNVEQLEQAVMDSDTREDYKEAA